MANRYVRSVFWLCSISGLGYGLLKLTAPSDEKIKELKKKIPGVEKNNKEVVSKNQQFKNVLQAATENNTPFYRLSKSEIEKELKK